MRLSLSLAAPLLVLLASGGVQAAASPAAINDVLANCPAGTAGDCSIAVTDFANGLPTADRDSDLLGLANSLAQKAEGSPEACGEIKAGIEAAANAAGGSARDQIAGMAQPLCIDVDMTSTGSIALPSDATPQSLVTQPDPDDL